MLNKVLKIIAILLFIGLLISIKETDGNKVELCICGLLATTCFLLSNNEKKK